MHNVNVTVTVDEGRFVYLPGNYRPRGQTPKKDEKPIAGRFLFQRLRDNGIYDATPSKPPGRLTWRRKVKAAQAKRGRP